MRSVDDDRLPGRRPLRPFTKLVGSATLPLGRSPLAPGTEPLLGILTLPDGPEDRPPEAVWTALVLLDEQDLIQLREGRVEIAYPLSANPTAFVARLVDGQERFACCAIDALGLAPMLGQLVHIRSRCHHCETPLELGITPEGPQPGADGIMVWVAKREAGERRFTTSL